MSTTPEISLIGTSRWAFAANGLTIFRLVMAPFLAVLVAIENPWWLTFWFGWMLGATDWLDGSLARRASPTKLGAFLDPMADKVLVLLVGFTLVGIGRFSILPMILITLREVAIMVYRTYWSRRGLSIPARKSAKYKTLVQGLALAAALCPALNSWLWVADGLLWLAVVFTIVSGLQYVFDGRDALRTTGVR